MQVLPNKDLRNVQRCQTDCICHRDNGDEFGPLDTASVSAAVIPGKFLEKVSTWHVRFLIALLVAGTLQLSGRRPKYEGRSTSIASRQSARGAVPISRTQGQVQGMDRLYLPTLRSRLLRPHAMYLHEAALDLELP